MWVSDARVCRFVMPSLVYGTWPRGSISQCWWPLSRHFWIALLHLLDSGIFLSQITLGTYIWLMTRCTDMVIPILYDRWSARHLWSCCNVFTATWVLLRDLFPLHLCGWFLPTYIFDTPLTKGLWMESYIVTPHKSFWPYGSFYLRCVGASFLLVS